MSTEVDPKICVVIPSWNAKDSLADCLDSLIAQTVKAHIILVDNGSKDGSADFVEQHYHDVEVIRHKRNKGFAGGVNAGFRRAIKLGATYVATFNNDAVADKQWLSGLVKCLDEHHGVGIAACKILSADGKKIDSTGDLYTVWGLPYPRGRDETDLNKYDKDLEIFGASGGASLYRVEMLHEIGLFDKDFFAYYEDIDLSFRAQSAGWKVRFVPKSVVYHQIGATSGKIKGFTTYQTMKNLPMIYWKNVPTRYLIKVGWRLKLAYLGFFWSAIRRGQFGSAFRGFCMSLILLPKKLVQRGLIFEQRAVSAHYIWGIMTHDLPPNAAKLRSMRTKWHRGGKD